MSRHILSFHICLNFIKNLCGINSSTTFYKFEKDISAGSNFFIVVESFKEIRGDLFSHFRRRHNDSFQIESIYSLSKFEQSIEKLHQGGFTQVRCIRDVSTNVCEEVEQFTHH